MTTLAQTFDLVWLGDPAVAGPAPTEPTSEEDAAPWVASHLAELHAGQRPDVFTCRALSSGELLRLSTNHQSDPAVVVAAAALGVVSIRTGDGRTIKDPDEVFKVIGVARNIEAVGSLCQAIVDVSREGMTAAPFRFGRLDGDENAEDTIRACV